MDEDDENIDYDNPMNMGNEDYRFHFEHNPWLRDLIYQIVEIGPEVEDAQLAVDEADEAQTAIGYEVHDWDVTPTAILVSFIGFAGNADLDSHGNSFGDHVSWDCSCVQCVYLGERSEGPVYGYCFDGNEAIIHYEGNSERRFRLTMCDGAYGPTATFRCDP
mgnify:CR=1 FL=1